MLNLVITVVIGIDTYERQGLSSTTNYGTYTGLAEAIGVTIAKESEEDKEAFLFSGFTKSHIVGIGLVSMLTDTQVSLSKKIKKITEGGLDCEENSVSFLKCSSSIR